VNKSDSSAMVGEEYVITYLVLQIICKHDINAGSQGEKTAPICNYAVSWVLL